MNVLIINQKSLTVTDGDFFKCITFWETLLINVELNLLRLGKIQ